MRNFFRYFSERFRINEYDINFKKEVKERQENIDKMEKEGILEKPIIGKRYAINKNTMSIFEIIAEKDSFFRVRNNEGIASWEEKDMFYENNIVYSTKEDFIDKEKNKLLSMIDTARYDVYIPRKIGTIFGEPSLEMIENTEKQNAEEILKFIKNHTTSDFKSGGLIFSNYILIGF